MVRFGDRVFHECNPNSVGVILNVQEPNIFNGEVEYRAVVYFKKPISLDPFGSYKQNQWLCSTSLLHKRKDEAKQALRDFNLYYGWNDRGP